MKKVIPFVVLLPMMLAVLAGCGGRGNNYTLEEAKASGFVVFENSNITSGQSAWDAFVDHANQGDPCEVTLAFYYTLDRQSVSPELYEEEKDDYPVLYIQKLRFDGKLFTLSYRDEDGKHTFQYHYLKRFETTNPPASALFTSRIWYALVNDKEVTGEQIERGMFSSRSGDWIDHQVVYSKYTYKN
ncbi:MAG: hypothetical protein FWC62_07690 [Firmicutes bacterium]|nr:hypothetical protein [Bacillota bacterium]